MDATSTVLSIGCALIAGYLVARALTLRVKRLEVAAEQDDRTVASYVERIIIADLTSKGLLKAKPRSSRRRS